MPKYCLLALTLLAMLPAQAADLPDLGEVSRVTLSQVEEARIGREAMQQIRMSRDYLDDPVVENYLTNLGDRLAASSQDPAQRFEFFTVNDPSINAFAMPGGYVGVHTGLINAARNESELAGVLGHEISHVTQHHIARLIDGQKTVGLASLAALAVAILAARSNTQMSEAAIVTAQAAGIQSQLNFTRDHEREADRFGLATLTGAGFAPQGMASFFERLQAQSRKYENNAPAYLRTHPLTYERIADIQDRLAHIPAVGRIDSTEFQLVRARIQAMEGNPADAMQRFSEDSRGSPGAASWYGLAKAALRAGDLVRARDAYTRLEKAEAGSPLVPYLEAEISLADKRIGLAVKQTAAALKQYPGYRPLAYLHTRSLLLSGRADDARAFLESQLRVFKGDARLYAMLAEAHQGLGHAAQSHLAQAEAYLLQDLTAPAIEQLQLAQRDSQADFYTASIVDARLRALKEKQNKEERPKR
jgi:predicted Zn-dependent protease